MTGAELNGAVGVRAWSTELEEHATILVVEPDEAIISTLILELARERYRLVVARSGHEAIDTLAQAEPRLVMLALTLPDMGGLDVCAYIQTQASVPIVLVSGTGLEGEALASFQAGADGYLTKPYRWRELTARVGAALRRSPPVSRRDGGVWIVGDIELDAGRHEVRVGGRLVVFPLREFELLQALLSSAGKTWTREALMQRIWGETPLSGTKSVDVHVKRIRTRIEDDPSRPTRLLTVRGVGYKYAIADAPQRPPP